MSEPHNPKSKADRNLLFGILALQLDFITRDSLIAAMNFWVLDKGRSLGQILVEQGALKSDNQALLESLVQKHIQEHDNDPEKSIATLGSDPSLRDELLNIADPDLQGSVAGYSALKKGPFGGLDPEATGPFTMGTTTSSGSRFTVVRPYSKGGLGEVFVAVDEELRREVILKQIQDRHADHQESRTRFLREAEITGSLEHPGIVPVYGLGLNSNGRPYYAMRFVRGESLREAIHRFHDKESDSPKRNRQRPVQTIELRKLLHRFIAVCDTVAYAHSRGVLHRDLKPANIMLGPFGETLVMDWGLAKLKNVTEVVPGLNEPPLQPGASDAPDLTQMGRALGTPAYMSPEQAAGRLDILGPASDVYGLGATLYCLLTGQAPFSDQDMGGLLRKVQQGVFQRPRQMNKTIPRALEAICLKSMALQPENRYASPGDLADDLERWLADQSVTVYSEPFIGRFWRWMYRHPFATTSLFVAILVILALANYVFDLDMLVRAPGLPWLPRIWLPVIFLFSAVIVTLVNWIWYQARLPGYSRGWVVYLAVGIFVLVIGFLLLTYFLIPLTY